MRPELRPGWFGIRGIGSLYYAAAIIDGRVLAESEAVKVFWTVVVLAGISIVAHGLTATSLIRRVERAGPARSGAAR
jgi:sodium/hydrogen antiporter